MYTKVGSYQKIQTAQKQTQQSDGPDDPISVMTKASYLQTHFTYLATSMSSSNKY